VLSSAGLAKLPVFGLALVAGISLLRRQA